MNASLGALVAFLIILESVCVMLCRNIYETVTDEQPIFAVFLTLVSVFCSIWTMSAKVMGGSLLSLESRTSLR